MRHLRTPALVAVLAAGAFGVAQTATADPHPTRNYVVVYEAGQSAKAAHRAIDAAGGRLLAANAAIGVATVASKAPAFVRRATAQRALLGAASDRPVGHTPSEGFVRPWDRVERAGGAHGSRAARSAHHAPGEEPLAAYQGDMRL